MVLSSGTGTGASASSKSSSVGSPVGRRLRRIWPFTVAVMRASSSRLVAPHGVERIAHVRGERALEHLRKTGGGEVRGHDGDVLLVGGRAPERDRFFREAPVAEGDDERRSPAQRAAHL